jgi:hypothetical protein
VGIGIGEQQPAFISTTLMVTQAFFVAFFVSSRSVRTQRPCAADPPPPLRPSTRLSATTSSRRPETTRSS